MTRGAEITEDLIEAEENMEMGTKRGLTVEMGKRIHLGIEKVQKIQEL